MACATIGVQQPSSEARGVVLARWTRKFGFSFTGEMSFRHFAAGLPILLASLGWAAAFQRVEIDPAPPQNPWIKVMGDINGDGKPDILIGGSKGPLVWYAAPGWSKHLVAEGGYDSVDAEAVDIDGDGDLDVVVGGVLWYENPGPQGDPQKGPWKAHRIATHRTHDVEAADLDGDGKADVVVRGQTGFGHKEGHRILIFRQNSPDEWSSREISCSEGEGLKLADLDADGDSDIVIAARWFENPGDILKGTWREHVYSTAWQQGDSKVASGDLNGDGRLDIVLTPAEFKDQFYRISWFEAPHDAKTGDWVERVIESRTESVVHAAGIADMDGDGRPDVVAASMHQGAAPQEVRIYLNGGSGRNWTKTVVSARGSHNIVLADLDGDGAIDILGANHGGSYQPVELWKGSPKRGN
jgi:hypothetical protein